MMASTRRKARAGTLTGPVSPTGPNRIWRRIGLGAELDWHSEVR
jgi:hypothetical protein